jgi:capsular polysaccharide biosynthesis protein/MinD-like ATPase involved in chromosome partitioning or flagellar assembly
MNQPREFTLRGYLDIIKRQWLLIALVTIVCTGAAVGLSLAQKKSYTATSSLAVSDPNQALDLLGGSYVSSTAAEPQVTGQAVVAGVKQSLNSPLTTAELRNKVSVSIDPNSYLIDIAASDRSPSQAAAIANAFATVDVNVTTSLLRASYNAQVVNLTKQLKHLSPTSAQYQSTQEALSRLKNLTGLSGNVQVAATATVPTSPSSPKPVRNTVAAFLFGLLLGIALGTARDVLDRRLRHSDDVTRVLDHPVVGHIRSEALGHAGPGVRQLGPLEGPDQESFRILRQNVQYLAAAADSHTVLITSPMAEEGKSTVAACMAVATAESGRRTLLVECDLRRPVLADRFAIKGAPGLTDYLTGNAEPSEILQLVPGLNDRRNGLLNGGDPATQQGGSNLVCITAGASVPLPAELLASERFHSFLAEVSEVYDSVILDTAPLLPVADTLGIVPVVSTILVCVRLGRTTRDQARSAQQALSRLPARPVGLVLTDVRQNEDGYYYGDYGKTPAGATA